MCKDTKDPRSSVLIVIGNADHRMELSALFEAQGYRVTLADDGADALRNIGARKFDLVVSGILMVEIDGLDLLRRLAQIAPDLPVIVIGDPDVRFNDVYLRCADGLGAARTHSYPPEPETLLADARDLIRKAQDAKAARRS
jgi:CheY-like chemotaxis protein